MQYLLNCIIDVVCQRTTGPLFPEKSCKVATGSCMRQRFKTKHPESQSHMNVLGLLERPRSRHVLHPRRLLGLVKRHRRPWGSSEPNRTRTSMEPKVNWNKQETLHQLFLPVPALKDRVAPFRKKAREVAPIAPSTVTCVAQERQQQEIQRDRKLGRPSVSRGGGCARPGRWVSVGRWLSG